MSDAVIGALRGVLVLDASDWSPAITRARGDLAGLRSAFIEIGRTLDTVASKMQQFGAGLTIGVTAPLAALTVTANRTASGFEASMKRVEAALKGVTGKELKALSDQARDLGPRVGKGATEAADGIEALGLAGVSTADILGGGLKASLDIAAAGAAPVADAAALVTDTMGQFKVTAAQLPTVVGNVVGALDASKFGFLDFQQALAQGGGVAASAGVSFADFATSIAATSTQFSSGSDAGTSFKTYIQSLVPVSKEAETAMKKLGIEFFDIRTGRMKPLAEQAEVLRKAFAGLSDKSKTDALKTIFGSDAARTAIGLMEKGRQGIVDLQREIAGGDVGGKIAKRLEGEAAATTRMANAFESLKIAIGEAGLTAAITSVKNAFASMLETVANSPALVRLGVVLGVVAAATGPLIIALGTVAKYVAVRLASSFGILGRAVSLIVAPFQTIAAMLLEFGAARALSVGLGAIGRAILGLTGPVGWAIGALLLFKDSIAAALSVVWDVAQRTLGPAFSALFEQVGKVVSSVVNGPIGSGFGNLVTVIKTVMDVAGTFIGAMTEMFGIALVQVIQIGVRAITGIVEAVGSVVKAIGALLSGDFVGAFTEAQNAVDAVCRAIVDIVSILLPDLTLPMKLAYEAARAFLVDGFASIAESFGGIIAGAVNFVAGAFPNVVTAAKGVYEGVKGWLVDKFGGLMTWIGNAAKWIGDKYGALKERLGLGGVAADGTPDAPAKPKPVTAPPVDRGTKVVNFDTAKTGRKKKGRDTTYDTGNRDQLRIDAELDAARARGDKEAEQRIQDRLALSKQIEAYQRTGLRLDKARAAAERDMATIHAGRAAAVAREIADEQQAVALDVARLGTDRLAEASLERQVELKRRVAFYYEQTKNLAEATRLAEADQVKVDSARVAVRQRWFEDDAADRAVRLAEARGDSEDEVRRLRRVIDIRRRARDLEAQGMAAGAALGQASSEWQEEDKARLTGTFRSTFRDGMRAAMDGNFGDFFKNFWKDRVAKGMEEALNSLSALIQRLFANVKIGSNGGAGGGILSALGSLFSKGSSRSGIAAPDTKFALSTDLIDLPKFNTGGSFRVGGMSGVDANVVSMRLTKGEMVDIRKPGNDNGGGGRWVIEPSPYFDVRAAGAARPETQAMGVKAAAGGARIAAADSAKRARRRIA